MRTTMLFATLAFCGALARPAQAIPLTGGTGPGGFVTTGALSDLTTWLKGDQGLSLSGSSVTSWADQSGHGLTYSQGDSNKQPMQSTSINGVTVVTFDGGGVATPAANADVLVGSGAVVGQTVFIMNNTLSFRSAVNPVISNTAPSYVSIRYDGAGWQHPGNADDFTNPAGSQILVNGVATTAAALGTNHILSAIRGVSAVSFTPLRLAQHGSGVSDGLEIRSWNGHMGELAIFNRAVTSVERVIVENYLSAKFNTGGTPVVGGNNTLGANDHYEGDLNTRFHFDHDVFGIGNDGTSSVTNAGSEGFGIEEGGGSLGMNEWVMAGHNGATGVTAGQWNRVWFIDKTQTDGVNATVAFDFSDYGAPMPSGILDVRLLYDDDDPSQLAPLSVTGTVIGDTVTFDLSNIDLQDGYYTLSANAIPEPSTFVLMGLGAVGLAWRVRRRRAA